MVRAAFRRLPALLLSLSIPAAGARAQTLEDEGLWFMLFAQGSFGDANPELGDLRWWLDVQPRFSDELGGLDQFLARPGIGYDLLPRTTVWAGYAWIPDRAPGGVSVDEDRIWQQLTWSPDWQSTFLQSRTRLEQRFVDSGSDVGWRLREFVKLSWPLPGEERLRLVGYDEVFFDLNDTDWGARTGFSQNRLFAGLGWSFAPGVVAEVGYLNQYVDREGPDRMNHILSVNLLISF